MDPQGLGVPPVEARCQLHFGQPFTAVCQRCGTYMCQQCTEGGRFDACPACRERTGTGSFPFTRERWSWGELLSFCVQAYKKHWLVLTLAMLLTVVAVGVVNAPGVIVPLVAPDNPEIALVASVVLFIPQLLVQAVCTLGLIAIAVRCVRGEPVELGMLFAEWRKIGGYLLQMLVMYMALIPIFLVGAVPFIIAAVAGGATNAFLLAGLTVPVALAAAVYVGLGFFFSTTEYISQPRVSAMDALRNSWAMAKGQRLNLFVGGLIAAALIFAGMMLCLVPVIFTAGFTLLFYAALYLTLRNGAPDLTT